MTITHETYSNRTCGCVGLAGDAEPDKTCVVKEHDLQTGSEEARLLHRWLGEESIASATEYHSARECGLAVIRDFTAEFAKTFCHEDSAGRAYVKKVLQQRFGAVTDTLIEAGMERIRNRRTSILDGFKRKYQSQLLAAYAVQVAQLPGYFRRVATLETLRLPEDCLPGRILHVRGLSQLVQTHDDAPEKHERKDSRRAHSLFKLISDWWSPENGFTGQQRQEGLVSLGLISLIEDDALRAQLRNLLETERVEWHSRYETLVRRCARLLTKLELVRGIHSSADSPDTAEELVMQELKATSALDRLNRRLDDHWKKYLPSPAEAQKILSDFGVPNLYSTRFRRIEREVAVLRHKLESELSAAVMLVSGDVADLAHDVNQHLSEWPNRKSGQTGRSATQHIAEWKRQGTSILERTCLCLNTQEKDHNHSARTLHLLYSVEDLYRLGIVSHTGVAAAFRRYSFRRLKHLLEVSGDVR